jgi:Txe/YoeB family toxin of Txe-Axe toxin-antitoxin module
MGMKYMTPESTKQYQIEERTMIANRLRDEKSRIHDLLETMKKDNLTIPSNFELLKTELAKYHHNEAFLKCNSTGDVVELNLNLLLSH